MHHQMPQTQGGQAPQQRQPSTESGAQMGQRLQDVETPQQRTMVNEITWAIQTCEWCAHQCIQLGDPNMAECIRLCEDVSELGETALTLIPRNSRHTQQLLQFFQQVLHACAQECGQHQHAHCQECAQVLPQAAQSIQQYAESIQQQGSPAGQQMGGSY